MSEAARRFGIAVGGIAALGVVFLLRSPSFGTSVIDWDESIYLLVSRELLRGHAPYTVIWDHKPPGLYALFAGFQLLFGQTIPAVRWGGALAVAATAAILGRCARGLFGSPFAGVLAAAVYLSQSLQSGGLATNTEILFGPFTAAGFLVLASRTPLSLRRAFAGGILFGLAAQVKYVAGFEFVAVLTAACVFAAAPGAQGAVAALRSGLAATAGFLSPLAFAAGCFLAAGRMPEYFQANFAANVAYVSSRLPIRQLVDALRWHADSNPFFWAGLALLPLAALLARRSARPFARPLVFNLAWLAGAAAGLMSIGRVWDHYFLELLPPLALLTGVTVLTAAECVAPTRARLSGLAAVTACTTYLLWPSLLSAAMSLANRPAPDTPRRVAGYLESRIARTDALYVPDWEPVLHYLVDAEIPTRFVLPYDLLDPAFARMAGVDRFEEIDRIFARGPTWVVKRASHRAVPGAAEFYAVLERNLERSYVLDARIGDAVLYRRR